MIILKKFSILLFLPLPCFPFSFFLFLPLLSLRWWILRKTVKVILNRRVPFFRIIITDFQDIIARVGVVMETIGRKRKKSFSLATCESRPGPPFHFFYYCTRCTRVICCARTLPFLFLLTLFPPRVFASRFQTLYKIWEGGKKVSDFVDFEMTLTYDDAQKRENVFSTFPTSFMNRF